MNPSATQRLTFPISDPPPRRGRRRRIYLKTLEVEIRPLDPASPKMKALLDLLFPEISGGDFSTNGDELV